MNIGATHRALAALCNKWPSKIKSSKSEKKFKFKCNVFSCNRS